MKTIKIEKKKKFKHIIGSETIEQFEYVNKENLDRYIAHYLEMLDGEQYEDQEDVIDSIYSLEDGVYCLDAGDFNIFVEIEDMRGGC